MADAAYFRDQANLCLEIARQISDGRVAQKLRSDAARYRAQADEIDELEQSRQTPAKKPPRSH